jgi:RNA recognition motif-containing protein
MNIYVSSLSFQTKSERLQELFEQFGEVSSANIITDRETGRSRGFGFVEMPNDAEGQAAINALNNTEFDGRTIIVNVARPKAEREDRGGYNRGGGGFNRGGDGYNRNRY